MIRRGEFWWPEDDNWCWRVIGDEVAELADILPLVPGRSVAVQAGGNVGVWAVWLAEHFATVHTVEPAPDNYACLVRNVPGNVVHRRAAFGAAAGRASLHRVAGNAGAHWTEAGDDFEVVTIDSLGLTACDFITMDVEGGELAAMQGAERTLREFRPVVQLEDKGLGERYFGEAPHAAVRWLEGLGYRVVNRVRKDVVLAA